jgi:EmrB/QacA subfamily drug resistance transporter
VHPPAELSLTSAAGRGTLATTVLAGGMVFLDNTIVSVAARRIGLDFSASFASLQWVLNGYTLALASLLLLGGSLGDRFGRRRIYLLGIGWFALASLGCALAPSASMLIAARVLQGVGGALLTPGSLAIIQSTFRPAERARAVGIWSGMTAVTTTAGPLVGGYLVQHASWRWAFAINLPLAAVGLGLRFVPRSRPEPASQTGRRLDYSGTALIALSMAALTYAATAAGSDGWRAGPLAIAGTGLLLLAAFGWVQGRVADPLLPLRLLADRTFAGANLMTFTTYAAVSVVLFLFVLNLQVSGHYGALAAGLATLPLTVMLLVVSPRAGALAARIGPRRLLVAGPLIIAAGSLITLRIDEAHRGYLLDVLPGMVVFGFGLACLVAPLTSAVMSAAPAADVGIASGVNNAVSRVAGLLAIAVIPPLAGLTGDKYRVPDDMTHSYRLSVLICVLILVTGAIVVRLTVPDTQQVLENAEHVT